jgi:alpha-tubulin suppressor-like RCC1 family protein
VAVAGSLRFLKLSVGGDRTCGIATDGKAYCWGRAGALGYAASGTCASDGCELLPRAVEGGLTFTEIATAGLSPAAHTCALTSAGVAYCWGTNSYGELGRGGFFSQAPAPVVTALTFRSIDVGDEFTCAAASGGTAYCWGRNQMGQLGTSAGSFVSANPVPLAVAGGRTYDVVFAGLGHACGITTSGQAYCWGRRVDGQGGSGASGSGEIAPQAVSGGLTWTTLDLGSRHTCGIASSGKAYCWGYNELGQLGTGDTTSSNVPVLVHERGR